MSDVLVFEGVWRSGTHRDHRGGGVAATIPRGHGFGLDGWQDEADATVAFPGLGVCDFLWWATGAASTEDRGADPRAVDAHFPPGHQAGSVSYWYRPEGDGAGGPPGLWFDAWSLVDGQFLDWDVDPFVVSPGTDRRDDLADSSRDRVTVSVSTTGWAGRADLSFVGWLVVNGQATATGQVVSADAGASAVAFALYGAPDIRLRWPWDHLKPQDWTMGDPAPIQEILQGIASRPEAGAVADLLATMVLRATTQALAPSLSPILAPAFDEAFKTTATQALAQLGGEAQGATTAKGGG